jgi:multidrug resistance efflux pump
MNVAVGDMVSEGDVLATLDAETLTSLQQVAAQARVNLEAAQDGLDALRGLQSGDPLVKALAESDLANAEVALDTAQKRLDDYQVNYNVELGTARKSVADAEGNLDQADEAVSDFADGYSEKFAEALETRSAAKLTLDAAEDTVNDFLPRHNESVGQKRTAISKTRSDLDDAEDAVLEFDARHAEELAKARTELAKAEVELDRVEDEFNEFQIRIYDESPSHLEPGQNFDVVQFNGLRAAVDVARQSVDNWKKEVSDLLAGPDEIDRTAAIAHVAELQATLVRLNRELNDVLAGPDQVELSRLEAAVEIARARLNRADRDLLEAEEGVDQLELKLLQATAESARFLLESAHSRLDRLEEGPDQVMLDALVKEIESAREARDKLTEEPEPAEIALAEARIEAAETAYQQAQEDVANAILRAPFDGMVTLSTISVGDIVTVDARVIQLVDPSRVSVLGLVETNYLDRIVEGASAAVTLGALPGVTLDAVVKSVSDDARTERGVISFPVVFDVTVPAGVAIPPNPGLVTTAITPRQ